MIITIDGYVATGKSTVAKKLAGELGFIFFDTGAMYRALTYSLLKHKVNIDNPHELEAFLKGFDYTIKIVGRRERRYFVSNEDVTEEIRSQEVTAVVSKVSAIRIVRDKLVTLQRDHAKGLNVVFEGRDMGTVVFPNANLKIFLTGKLEVRAKRRYEELRAKFPERTKSLTLDQCLEEIAQRDHYDSSREISPLCQAKDALVIDTSDLTVEEIVLKILEHKDSLKTK